MLDLKKPNSLDSVGILNLFQQAPNSLSSLI